MADLGDIIARAATNAALAQSEQLTGIPFFQQAQARQERESVRQDQVAANLARLNAGIRTGLINEKDALTAGTPEELARLKNFDDIFKGFVNTASIARTESKNQEEQRLNAMRVATNAGVSGDYSSMSTEELYIQAAATDQKRDSEARQTQRFKDAYAATEDALTALESTENPTPDHAAAVSAQVSSFVQAAGNPEFAHMDVSAFVSSLNSRIQRAAKTINKNKDVAAAAEGVTRNDWTALAQSEYRDEALKRADVGIAVKRVNDNLRTIQGLSELDEGSRALLVQKPELAQAFAILDALPKGSQNALTLLNDNPGLLPQLAQFDSANLAEMVKEAKVRSTVPDLVDTQVGIYKAAQGSLPPTHPLYDILEGAISTQAMDVVRNPDGTYRPILSPDAKDPVQEALQYLQDNTKSVSDRYRLAYTMGRGGVGGVTPTAAQEKIFLKFEEELFGRLGAPDQEAIEIDTFDDNKAQFLAPFKGVLESGKMSHLGKGGLNPDIRNNGREAVTGRASATIIEQQITKLSEQAATTTDSSASTLLGRRIKLLEERKEEALMREGALSVLNDTFTAFYTSTKTGESLATDVIERFKGDLGIRMGFDSETLPGEVAFKEAMDRAGDDVVEQRAAIAGFIGKAFHQQDPELVKVLENYIDILETAEEEMFSGVRGFARPRDYEITGFEMAGFDPRRPIGSGSAMVSAVERKGGITLDNVTVKIPKKRRLDADYVLPLVIISALR
jgi:hypothetical protein